MSEQTTAVTTAQPQDLAKVRETMERNELILSAKTQTMVNQLKNLDRHFYSVGKFKAPDGTWQDKLEPDAFAVQTMSTLQQINTEVLSMTWENPDDLLNAAVTVRVRGWKGKKISPDIEKTVELRLSMKAIAAKYVMDKLEPKKKWNDASRRKEEMPPEWTEADVVLRDDGWVQPKGFKHQVAMRSYLIDQFSFMGRTAESKAEHRVNLKLLGFDWRDPDEITDEGGERNAVAATKEKQTADPGPVIAAIDQCKTEAEIDALTPTLTVETGRLSEDDRQKVFQRLKERRDAVRKPARPDMTGKVIDHRDGNHTNSEASNLEVVDAADVPPAKPQDASELPKDEFDSWMDGLKAQETEEGVEDCHKATSAKPMSEGQKILLDELRLQCLKQLEPKKTSKKK